MIAGTLKSFIPRLCGGIRPHCQQADVREGVAYDCCNPAAYISGFRGPSFAGEAVFNHWQASPMKLSNQGADASVDEGEVGSTELEYGGETARLH